jgi:AraC family transcriptional activator of pobA
MKKVKNTIPVYDICSLTSNSQLSGEIIAQPFATYLKAHPNLHKPHRHSFYHIVLFTKGAGFHTIDFERFDVAPGQIYFMKPGQVHSWSFKGEVDGYVINFSDDLFNSFLATNNYLDSFAFFQGIANECVVDLDKQLFVAARDIIASIVDEAREQQPQMVDLIRVSLIRLFIIINRGVAQNPNAAKPQNQVVLHDFRKLVDKYYAEKRLPKNYADMLYITPNYLNALSNHLLGKSAGEVIRERILLEAKRLLVNAELSMAEIAGRLSFTDNAHFSKFFRKYTNSTPEEFRRSSFI